MDARRVDKRHCPGEIVSFRQEGLGELGGGSLDVHQAGRVGSGGIQSSDVLVESRPQEVGGRSGSGLGGDEWGRQLKNLDAVLLEQVFSHLSQKDRLRARLVSRYWDQVLKEGHVPWRKVHVGLHGWDLRARDRKKGRNAYFYKVLEAAQDLSFSELFHLDKNHILSLASVVGVNLRSLQLYRVIVSPAFQTLLDSCPKLQSLVFNTEPWGWDPMHIAHPKLETLKIPCRIDDRTLTVNCASLTYLSTENYFYDSRRHHQEPLSLHCPRLRILCLSAHHCATGVLDWMADHAPNIEVLHAYRTANSQARVLRHFKSLRALTFKVSKLQEPDRPRQERFPAHAKGWGEDLAVAYHGLRDLNVHADLGFFSPTVTCPSLEDLYLDFDKFRLTEAGKDWIGTLNSVCPRLKRAVVRESADKEAVSVELFHEGLEELEVVKRSYVLMRVACPNLGKLRMTWEGDWRHKDLSLAVDCPKITDFHVHRYSNLTRLFPVLSALPELRKLTISSVHMKYDIVLDHAHIKDVVIENCQMKKVVLDMPRLKRVRVFCSGVHPLQVVCLRAVWLASSGYDVKDGSRKLIYAGEINDVRC